MGGTENGDEHGKYEGNTEAYEKYQGYHEDHECDVYDLFYKAAEGKEKTGRYRTVFLYAAAGIPAYYSSYA